MKSSGLESGLLARATARDESAQRLIYERYHQASFRLAYLMLRNRFDAEEVVQDAFVYALRNVERYDPSRGAFWTWLRVIVVSRCRNKRRRQRVRRISLSVLESTGQVPADPERTGDPPGVFERDSRRSEIWEALHEVSPGARDALVLRYYEGLPYAEIGELLGCSSAAARSRVAHGKAQLRALLAPPGSERRPEGRAVRGAETT